MGGGGGAGGHPDLATPRLLAKVAEETSAAARVLASHPSLATPQLLAKVCADRESVHAVVDACGPFPALWRQLTEAQQSDVLSRYRCTPAEREWLRDLAQRVPPTWTAADDTMAARFPWRETLRATIHAMAPVS